MDWYVIEYLYSESFKKFIKTMFPNVGIVSLTTLELYDIKKLYKFFDKEGIYLNVEICYPNQWLYNISLKNGTIFSPLSFSKKTREEIEIEGFTECFKILDKKIRDTSL
jgi:hypothetical protein